MPWTTNHGLEATVIRHDQRGVFVRIDWNQGTVTISGSGIHPKIQSTLDAYQEAEGMDMFRFIDHLITQQKER